MMILEECTHGLGRAAGLKNMPRGFLNAGCVGWLRPEMGRGACTVQEDRK